ncbi:MAG: putative Ig domain-containing protein, partial [Terracidiphilus sp.]
MDGTDTTTVTATVANDKNSAGVTWTVSGGGTLSSTTTTSATYTAPAATSSSQTATITATSIADTSKIGTATITIPAAPSVTSTSSSLTGAVGAAYSVTLAASGGIAPYTWALGSGATLPACLTLRSTGVITTTSGLPPTASCAGTYSNLTFKVTDSGAPTPLTATSAALTITITAAPPLALAPAVTPATAPVGTLYAGSVASVTPGGVGPLTYGIASGALPAALTLNTSSGAITGTPTTSGTANFTIQAADNFGDTPATQAYTLTVNAEAQTISFSNPGTQTVGTPLTLTATASSGLAVSYSSQTTG